MRKTGCLAMILGMLFFVAFVPSAAMATNKVLVIGDSWGFGYADNLQTQFATHGHGDWEVVNAALLASTADAWADPAVLSPIIDALNSIYPSINYVVVSLGGNDLHLGSPYEQIEADLRTIVQRLSNEANYVQGIVLPGYDILNYGQSTECQLLALAFFGVVFPWEVNPLYLELGNRQQIVANEFPEATYLNLWGTGQGNPGSPNISEWSSSGYVSSDCIHLNETGYNQFTEEIYCQYFAPTALGENCNPGPVYAATANAEAASYGSSSLMGSGTFNGLSLLLFPTGVVLFMRFFRRKR